MLERLETALSAPRTLTGRSPAGTFAATRSPAEHQRRSAPCRPWSATRWPATGWGAARGPPSCATARTRPTASPPPTAGALPCASTAPGIRRRTRFAPSWPGWRACARAACGLRGPRRDSTAIRCRPLRATRAVARERRCCSSGWTASPLSAVDEVEPWERLGEIMAELHAHARAWKQPSWFTRPAWDAEALVGDDPRWGAPDPEGLFGGDDRGALEACRAEVHARLDAIGAGSDRYGLVHCDLAFENVLVADDGSVVIIDFDDSGPSWYLHDFAVPLYPYQVSGGLDDRRDALVAGYRHVSGLSDRSGRRAAHVPDGPADPDAGLGVQPRRDRHTPPNSASRGCGPRRRRPASSWPGPGTVHCEAAVGHRVCPLCPTTDTSEIARVSG